MPQSSSNPLRLEQPTSAPVRSLTVFPYSFSAVVLDPPPRIALTSVSLLVSKAKQFLEVVFDSFVARVPAEWKHCFALNAELPWLEMPNIRACIRYLYVLAKQNSACENEKDFVHRSFRWRRTSKSCRMNHLIWHLNNLFLIRDKQHYLS